VREKESPRVLAVRADATDFGCEVNDDVRLVLSVKPLDVLLARQIEFRPPRDYEIAVPALLELFDDNAAEKSGAAGDEDAHVNEPPLPCILANPRGNSSVVA